MLTNEPGQLSLNVSEPNATPLAVHKPASVLITTVEGALMVGTSVSLTVTV